MLPGQRSNLLTSRTLQSRLILPCPAIYKNNRLCRFVPEFLVVVQFARAPITVENSAAGIGQILAHFAVFSVFYNWLVFSMFSALGRENPKTFPFVINKFSALANYRAGGRQTTTQARASGLRRAASSHSPRTYSSLQALRCQGESFPTEPCLALASISDGAANRDPVPAGQTAPPPNF